MKSKRIFCFLAGLFAANCLAFAAKADATTPSYENCVAGTATCQTKTKDGVTVYYTVENDTMTIYGPTTEGEVASVPYMAFWQSSLPSNVNFSGNVDIGQSAFGYVTGVSNINLTGVQTIAPYAFQHATGLTSVDLTGVQTVGQSSFAGVTSLTSVNLTGVQTVGNSAFENCTGLTSVDLTGVQTISPYAFSYATSLTSVDLTGVQTIGAGAFRYAAGLTSIDLTGVQTIGDGAFVNCTGLTSLDLTSVETIGESAFQRASNLEKMVLGDNVSSIGRFAFSDVPSTLTLYCQDKEGAHGGKTCADLVASDKFTWFTGTLQLFTKGDDDVYSIIKDGTTYYYSSADKMMTGGVEEGCETQEACAAVVRLASTPKMTSVQNADGSTTLYDANGNVIGFKGKRIYTVEEATKLSKETGNTFKLRYK